MVTSTQPRAMSARESTVQKAKVATSIAFVLNGFTFATWASRIPDVRTALDLTPGDLTGVVVCCETGGDTAVEQTSEREHFRPTVRAKAKIVDNA